MFSSALALIGDSFQARIGIWKGWFLRRGPVKTAVPGEKPLGTEKRTSNKFNPHMTPGPGIEPGTHRRRARSPLRIPAHPWFVFTLRLLLCFFRKTIITFEFL